MGRVHIEGGRVGNYEYIFANQVYDYIPTDTIFLTTGEHPFVFIDAQGCLSDTVLVDKSYLRRLFTNTNIIYTKWGHTK